MVLKISSITTLAGSVYVNVGLCASCWSSSSFSTFNASSADGSSSSTCKHWQGKTWYRIFLGLVSWSRRKPWFTISLLSDYILTYLNSFHTFITHLNIILLHTSKSAIWSLSLRLSNQILWVSGYLFMLQVCPSYPYHLIILATLYQTTFTMSVEWT